MIPYKADVMMQRLPWANWVIIGVTIVISLAAMYGPVDASPFALWRDLAPWQLVTHAFLHGGLMHLFGNMMFLFVFGNAVNAKIGHVAYSALYVGFALITGLAWLLFPGDGLVMLGASGAIMGVAGMFAVLYPLNEISIFTIFMFRPIVFDLSSMWFLLIYFGLNFLGFLGGGGDVAHISHLSGMMTGAAVAWTLVMTSRLKPSPGEKTLLEVFHIKVAREERRRRVPPPIVPVSGDAPQAKPVPPKPPSQNPKRYAPPGGW